MVRVTAPESLDSAGKRLWREVTSRYDLAPHEAELLRQACRVVDLLARVDVALMDSELVVEGHAGQPRAHPLMAASVMQRSVLDGLFRSMGLPMPDEDEGRRRSKSAVAVARARWRSQSGG